MDLSFVSYEPGTRKRGDGRDKAIRAHAGKAGWLKSAKAAELEVKKKRKEQIKTQGQCKAENDAKDGIANGKGEDLLLRAVAPVFGGMQVETFDTADDTTSARISYLMLTAVWPNVAGDSVAAPWFVDFCNDPLMFHTHCTAGAMYRDILAQRPEWSQGAVTLAHKGKTLSLIKDSFSKLDSLSNMEMERLILSMGILGVHDFDPRHVETKPLPFSPHFPAANWLALWGRSDPVEPHVTACIAIAQRLGGPKAVQLPGLGYMSSLTDVFRASVRYCRPIMEPFWDDVHIVEIMPEELIRPPELLHCTSLPRLPGSGFANLPGGLPPIALSIFTELAYVDRIMSQSPSKVHPTNPLQRVKLAVCHKLLSLPPWEELNEEEILPQDDEVHVPYQTNYTEKSHRTIYEICRLICVIYFNACLFPLPPHNGWNARHTTRARGILVAANFATWTSNVEGLYLWVLVIGGMAAFDTSNRKWFEKSLNQYVETNGLELEYVLEQCRLFVWTDQVCEAGARELWDAAVTPKARGNECNVKYEA